MRTLHGRCNAISAVGRCQTRIHVLVILLRHRKQLKNADVVTVLQEILVSLVIATTRWKINMEPENHLLERENHLKHRHFRVPC